MKLNLGCLKLSGLNFVKTYIDGRKEIMFQASNDQEAQEVWNMVEKVAKGNYAVGIAGGAIIGALSCLTILKIRNFVKEKHNYIQQKSVIETGKTKSGKFRIGFCAAEEKGL